MARSSFIVRHVDPDHEPVLQALRSQYGTTATSTALSRLLDDYLREQQQAAHRDAVLGQLQELLHTYAEQDKAEKFAAKAKERALKEALALAASTRKAPRQLFIP